MSQNILNLFSYLVLKETSGNKSILFLVKGHESFSCVLKAFTYTQEKNQTSDSDLWVVAGRIADWTDRVSAEIQLRSWKENYGSSFKKNTWANTANLACVPRGSTHVLKPNCDADQKSSPWVAKWIAILVVFFLLPKVLNTWSQLLKTSGNFFHAYFMVIGMSFKPSCS